jgi:hypothetical protein
LFRLAFHEWYESRQTDHGNRVTVSGAATFGVDGMHLTGGNGIAAFFTDFGGLHDTDITIEAWIKPYGPGGGGFGRFIDNTKIIGFIPVSQKITFESDGSTVANSAADIKWGIWQRIAITRVAATGSCKFYIGTPYVAMSESDGSDPLSGIPVAGVSMVIGNNSGGSRGFNGVIDEVIIYKEIRSLAQIERNRIVTWPGMAALDYLTSNLVALGDYSHQSGTFTDYGGVTHTAAVGVTFDSLLGASFPNLGDKFDLGATLGNLDGALTIMCRFRADSGGGNNYGRILDNGKLALGIAGPLNAIYMTSNGGAASGNTGTNSITAGQEYMLGVTRAADGTCNFYLGTPMGRSYSFALIGNTDQDSGTPVAGTHNPYVGDDGGNSTWDGYIDDILIYNAILTHWQMARNAEIMLRK